MNETTQQYTAVILLFLNIAAYFAGNIVAKGFNFILKREAVSRRMFGTGGVVILSCLLLINSLGALRSHEAALEKLTAFERGSVEGQVIGRAIVPGILVLAGVAISARFRARRSKSATHQTITEVNKPVKNIGDKVATIIFWLIGGALLLLLVVALISGS